MINGPRIRPSFSPRQNRRLGLLSDRDSRSHRYHSYGTRAMQKTKARKRRNKRKDQERAVKEKVNEDRETDDCDIRNKR